MAAVSSQVESRLLSSVSVDANAMPSISDLVRDSIQETGARSTRRRAPIPGGHAACLSPHMESTGTSIWTRLAGAVAAALLAATAAHAARVALGVRRAHAYSQRAQRYARHLEDASHRLLIVGDSTGVGLGALNMEDSIAGRLAQDFPQASIENRAELGARIACVLGQLSSVEATYDAVLIAAGGNDILHRTPYCDLRAALEAVITRAREVAPLVIVVNSGNVGGAPLFGWPLSVVLSRRSLQVRRIFALTCRRMRAQFVNLTFVPRRDPFGRQRELYFAEDGLHPSSAAYQYCYDVLKRRTRLTRLLAAA
jgi:lysophospholipase L1-like esterase